MHNGMLKGERRKRKHHGQYINIVIYNDIQWTPSQGTTSRNMNIPCYEYATIAIRVLRHGEYVSCDGKASAEFITELKKYIYTVYYDMPFRK